MEFSDAQKIDYVAGYTVDAVIIPYFFILQMFPFPLYLVTGDQIVQLHLLQYVAIIKYSKLSIITSLHIKVQVAAFFAPL